VPHPEEGGLVVRAVAVGGDHLIDPSDAMVEVHWGKQAVRWRAGGVIDPDTSAGIIDSTEEQAAGFDVRSA
jgi:hypothetical protein